MLQAHFRPEFLNRIDEIVIFHPLTPRAPGGDRRHPAAPGGGAAGGARLPLEVSEAAREYLAEVGYDPDFGARPLKRAIQRELQDPLALHLLSGEFHEGDMIQVDRGPDGLTFTPALQARW